MQIDNHFFINKSLSDAWSVLLNIPQIVDCVPGASLLASTEDKVFRGEIRIKLGPIPVAFRGTAEFKDIDEANYSALVVATGNEIKGRGGAQAQSRFQLSLVEAGKTRVDVSTNVTLNGAVAQYGRAQGVIVAVAQQIIDQFSSNLHKKIAAASNSSAVDASAALPVKARELSVFSLIFLALKQLLFKRGCNSL